MTMSAELGEIMGLLSTAWRRQVSKYMSDEQGQSHIFVVYKEEALTGWVSFHEKPTIDKFRGKPAVCIPLARWVMVKALSDATVTPAIIVAQGKKKIQLILNPHTGLKYPVRNVGGQPQVMFLVEDFEDLGAHGRADTQKTGDDRKRKRR